MKDATMQTENIRTPKGSKRFLPVGYSAIEFFLPAAYAAPQIMSEDSRSRAASTNEARRDTELEKATATPFRAVKMTFTTMFTVMELRIAFVLWRDCSYHSTPRSLLSLLLPSQLRSSTEEAVLRL